MDIQKFEDNFFVQIRNLIDTSRSRVAEVVNTEISILYWNIGMYIKKEILIDERALYGKEIIGELSLYLTNEYGKGWSKQQLWHCIHVYEVFFEWDIFYTLCRELSWSHIRIIMYLNEPLQRDFYIEMCKMNHWSVRTLKGRIDSRLFERTAISKRPDNTIRRELDLLKKDKKLNSDMVFRDPYFLDYLGLKDTYSERDLESAIIAELQQFIIEMGSDFAFLTRQKRITIDDEDYYIDLLFYHRRFHCLVAVDLKLGKFQAAYKGQMELYLRWLERYDMADGENPPIGLILCSGKNEEHIELLKLDESNIRVADYLTKLPDMRLLEKKLKISIERAKAKLTK